jgi:hypothetical protein
VPAKVKSDEEIIVREGRLKLLVKSKVTLGKTVNKQDGRVCWITRGRDCQRNPADTVDRQVVDLRRDVAAYKQQNDKQ